MTETFKVSKFLKQNIEIISCQISDSIEKAKTLMLLNDFSQLPALNENGKIEGGISWKSIGKNEAIGKKGGSVKDYIEEPAIIRDSGDFLKYIKLVAKKDYVFVVNYRNEIKGIITTYDMTLYFREFITPFLKLGVIEDSIRKLIIENALKTPKDKDVNELVFNQYSLIFSDNQNWEKLKFSFIDKEIFIEKLNQIRQIRNKVAHYKPEPLNSNEHFIIESFCEIIQKIGA